MDALDHELRQHYGISLAEYDVLSRLSMLQRRECRMADLALSANQSRSRLSHTVSRLERAGLMIRKTDSRDGRGVVAQLTDTGWQLLTRAAKLHVTGVRRRLVDRTNPEDFAAFGRVFRSVENYLDCEENSELQEP